MKNIYVEAIDFLCLGPTASVFSFLSCTRPIFNSSIIPTLLQDPSRWQRITGYITPAVNAVYRLFALSDTLQFAPWLIVPFLPTLEAAQEFTENILLPLLYQKQYFSCTLRGLRLSNRIAEELILPLVLSRVRSLEHVVLCYQVTNKTFEYLCTTTTTTTTNTNSASLSSLEFFGNADVKEGWERLRLQQVSSSSSLRFSSLQSLKVHSAFDIDFIDAFPNLRQLYLSADFFHEYSKSLDISALANLRFLRHLSLVSFTTIDSESLQNSLSQLHSLNTLTISGCSCPEGTITMISSLKFLDSMPHLQELDLSQNFPSYNNLSPLFKVEDQMKHIASLPNLRSLSLRANPVIDDEALEVLSSSSYNIHTTLEVLNLERCQISNKIGLSVLLKKFVNLRELDIRSIRDLFQVRSDFVNVTLPVLASSVDFPKLETLHCTFPTFYEDSQEELNKMIDSFKNGFVSLRRLCVRGVIGERIPDHVRDELMKVLGAPRHVVIVE